MPQLNSRRQKPGGGSWYSIAAKDTGPVEVFIYDEIGGWGIGADAFVKDLRAHKGKDISLRLNTPGGSVFDGHAIYNALREHGGKVSTSIDGLAASIGSVIALAGETVKMAKNAFFMIHDPWGFMVGNADEMRKTAELLDKIKGTMVSTYAERSGKDDATVSKWMNDETWFTAEEAKEAGFCDEVGDEIKIAASFDLSIYSHVPGHLLAGREDPPGTEREFEKSLRDAGMSRTAAAAAVAAARTIYQRDADGGIAFSKAKMIGYEFLHSLRA